MIPPRFPRAARVRARADFDRIFKQGRRVALPMLALHWLPDGADATRDESEIDDTGIDGSEINGGEINDSKTVDKMRAAAPRARLGLAVSRKVDPHAVGRNRIKRALRELFRHYRGQLRAGDYVVVARRAAADCNTDQLQQALLNLLRRADALPLSAPPVTMPAAARSSPVSAPPAPASRSGRER